MNRRKVKIQVPLQDSLPSRIIMYILHTASKGVLPWGWAKGLSGAEVRAGRAVVVGPAEVAAVPLPPTPASRKGCFAAPDSASAANGPAALPGLGGCTATPGACCRVSKLSHSVQPDRGLGAASGRAHEYRRYTMPMVMVTPPKRIRQKLPLTHSTPRLQGRRGRALSSVKRRCLLSIDSMQGFTYNTYSPPRPQNLFKNRK